MLGESSSEEFEEGRGLLTVVVVHKIDRFATWALPGILPTMELIDVGDM